MKKPVRCRCADGRGPCPGDKIAEDDKELKDIEARLKEILMTIPNMPAADTPVGSSDADNPVVRTWREPAKFAFEPQAHWDIGEKLNILDVERAGKVSAPALLFIADSVPGWNVP